VDSGALHDRKTAIISELILSRWRPGHLLVVGCGDGSEAAVLARKLGAHVTGIDLRPTFNPRALEWADLKVGDATKMEFENESFDFVYSYHALEHIPQYPKAVAEMQRVLKPGGGCCVGTPNRARIVGYFSSTRATLRQKLVRNVRDWNAMIRGRFRNEYGAHAGFTAAELHGALSTSFRDVEDITFEYYARLYKRRNVEILSRCGVSRFILPAVYFMASRE
jgi:ubiquinone/menaquinone biosynthesis C-methylase UbiE